MDFFRSAYSKVFKRKIIYYKWQEMEINEIDHTVISTLYVGTHNNENVLVRYKPMITKTGVLIQFTLLLTDEDSKVVVKSSLVGIFVDDDSGKPPKVANLESLDTDSEFRNQGYGSIILGVYLKYMQNIGIKTVTAKKARYDERLVRFYERFGFKVDNRKLCLELT